MNFKQLMIIVNIILLPNAVIHAVLIETPMNIAVVEGAPVQLNCSTNDTRSRVRWFHRINSEETMIYSGNQIPNKSLNYSIDKSNPGEYHLILNHTTMSSAGTYTCNEFQRRTNASAEIIVMANEDPICESKVKYRDIMDETEQRTRILLTVCCTVSFRGNWSPILVINGESGRSEKHSVVNSPGRNSLTQIVTFLLETGIASFHFSFHVKFSQVHWNKSTAATNVPDFQLSKEMEHLLPAEETHNETHLDPHYSFASPENLAVIAGGTATLNCSIPIHSMGPLRWLRFHTGEDLNPEYIFLGSKLGGQFVNSSYKIDRRNNRTVNLVIDPVQSVHGGRYVCLNGVGTYHIGEKAELIVLVSEPNCTHSYSTRGPHSVTTLSCTVHFNGNWAPTMEWTDDMVGRDITNDACSTVRNGSVTSELRLVFNSSESEMREYRFTCTTKFTGSLKPQGLDATNVPLYTYAHVFNVTYVPNNTVSKKQAYYDNAFDHVVKYVTSGAIAALIIGTLCVFIVYVNTKREVGVTTNHSSRLSLSANKPENLEDLSEEDQSHADAEIHTPAETGGPPEEEYVKLQRSNTDGESSEGNYSTINKLGVDASC